MIRPQYHFRPGPNGLRAWNVARLIRLSKNLPIQQFALQDLAEIDEAYWGTGNLTVRQVAEHALLMREADLSVPIIICAEGRVIDGMHRVAQALMLEHETIPAVQFRTTPEPDHENSDPNALSYDPKDFVV